MLFSTPRLTTFVVAPIMLATAAQAQEPTKEQFKAQVERASAMIVELQSQVQMMSARATNHAATIRILRGKLEEAKKAGDKQE